jgi:hypothetical protein
MSISEVAADLPLEQFGSRIQNALPAIASYFAFTALGVGCKDYSSGCCRHD